MNEVGKWLRGFLYAYNGLQYSLTTQRNMRFHFFAACTVLFLALIFQLRQTEMLFLLLAVTLVMAAELVNTAIEKTIDLAIPDQHPTAKIAKDVAAASVLVTAAFAAVVGIMVLLNPAYRLLVGTGTRVEPLQPEEAWISVILVGLLTIALQTYIKHRAGGVYPSLAAAVSFSASACIALFVPNGLVVLLFYTLSFLLSIILLAKSVASLSSFLFGAIFGSLMTFLCYYYI